MPNVKMPNAAWTAPTLKRLAANLAENAGASPGDGPLGQKS